jgi:hypothetical protein
MGRTAIRTRMMKKTSRLLARYYLLSGTVTIMVLHYPMSLLVRNQCPNRLKSQLSREKNHRLKHQALYVLPLWFSISQYPEDVIAPKPATANKEDKDS